MIAVHVQGSQVYTVQCCSNDCPKPRATTSLLQLKTVQDAAAAASHLSPASCARNLCYFMLCILCQQWLVDHVVKEMAEGIICAESDLAQNLQNSRKRMFSDR